MSVSRTAWTSVKWGKGREMRMEKRPARQQSFRNTPHGAGEDQRLPLEGKRFVVLQDPGLFIRALEAF